MSFADFKKEREGRSSGGFAYYKEDQTEEPELSGFAAFKQGIRPKPQPTIGEALDQSFDYRQMVRNSTPQPVQKKVELIEEKPSLLSQGVKAFGRGVGKTVDYLGDVIKDPEIVLDDYEFARDKIKGSQTFKDYKERVEKDGDKPLPQAGLAHYQHGAELAAKTAGFIGGGFSAIGKSVLEPLGLNKEQTPYVKGAEEGLFGYSPKPIQHTAEAFDQFVEGASGSDIEKRLAYPIGLIGGFLMENPIGGEFKALGSLLKLSKETKAIIAASKNADEISSILQREIKGLDKETSNAVAQGLVHIDNVTDVDTVFKRVDFELNKAGEVSSSLATTSPETFTGLVNTSTKVVDALEGKGVVSRGFVRSELNRISNQEGVKQAERDIIEETLAEMPERFSASEFAEKVQGRLLPLERDNVPDYDFVEEDGVSRSDLFQYENVSLPYDIRGNVAEYDEIIYSSPIRNSAGDIHFRDRDGGAPENYFAHTRIEDMADGSTRRVIEAQSDLFQKGRLENEADTTFRDMTADEIAEMKKYDPQNYKVYEQNLVREQELSKLEPYRNIWHERLVREEVAKAAQDGKTKLQFPTGETAMKIEGLGENAEFFRANAARGMEGTFDIRLKPDDLSVGEEIYGNGSNWIITEVLEDGKFKAVDVGSLTKAQRDKLTQGKKVSIADQYKEQFDISGKVDTSNPIYKFYESTVAKYLKKNYGAKRVTDEQGVEWMEVEIDPKLADRPVQAFSLDGDNLSSNNNNNGQNNSISGSRTSGGATGDPTGGSSEVRGRDTSSRELGGNPNRRGEGGDQSRASGGGLREGEEIGELVESFKNYLSGVTDFSSDEVVRSFNDFSTTVWQSNPRNSINIVSNVLKDAGLPELHVAELKRLAKALPDDILEVGRPIELTNHKNASASIGIKNNKWTLSLNIESLKRNPNRSIIEHEGIGHLSFSYAPLRKRNEYSRDFASWSQKQVEDIFLNTRPENYTADDFADRALVFYFNEQSANTARELLRLLDGKVDQGKVIAALEDTGLVKLVKNQDGTYSFKGKINDPNRAFKQAFNARTQIKEMIEGLGYDFDLTDEAIAFLDQPNLLMANEVYARIVQLVAENGAGVVEKLPDGVVKDRMSKFVTKRSSIFSEAEVSTADLSMSSYDPYDEYAQIANNLDRRAAGDVDAMLEARFTSLTNSEKRFLLERSGLNDTGLSPALEQRAIELELRKDSLDENPAKQLAKYSPAKGEFAGTLPEVTGDIKGGVFARRGDDIANELGFKDSEEARSAYNKYKEDKTKYMEMRREFVKDRREFFQVRKERQSKEVATRQRIRDELRGMKAEKARVDKRRTVVRAYQNALNITNKEMSTVRKGRDLRMMDNYEFEQFLNDVERKAVEIAETRQAKAELMQLLEDRHYKKVDNYRQVLGLPTIDKMSTAQLRQYMEALEPFQVGDEFLTKRTLEVVDRTNLKGIKTMREAREKLAQQIKKETGKDVSVEDLTGLKASAIDNISYDTHLAEKNPFYQLVVQRTQTHILEGEARFLEVQDRVQELAKKANSSRKRSVSDRLIPKNKEIIEYLEAPIDQKEAVAQNLTKEELDYANYISEYYTGAYDHLIRTNELQGSRFVDQYFTHTRKKFLEKWSDDGLVEAFKNAWDSHKEDQVIANIIDQDTGQILPKSKFFQYTLQRTGDLDPSENVTRVFLQYAQMFERKRMFDKMIPEVDIYTQVLTPKNLTPRGLEMDRSLKTFVNKYLNNKKNRKENFGGLIKQNGPVDMALRMGNTFVSLLDLGLSLPAGIAASVGEQMMTYQGLGKIKYATALKRRIWDTGLKRMGDKNASKILKEAEPFIGRNIWTELSEVDKGIGERVMQGMWGLFAQSSVEANKLFLLGSLTKAELAAGKISADRLAKLRIEAGRWRDMGRDVKSIVGSTSLGTTITKYKGWAIPIGRTTAINVATIAKKLKDREFKEVLTSRETAELYRAIETSLVLLAVGSYVIGENDDETFIGRLKARAYQEAMTFLGGTDPTLFLSTPRLYSFTQTLADNLWKIIKLEEYKQDSRWGEEGDLKGVAGAKRQLTPAVIEQFENPTSSDSTSTGRGSVLDLPDLPKIKRPELPELPKRPKIPSL